MNLLSYSVVFTKKINQWSLHHWCFLGKFMIFLKQRNQPSEVFCKFIKKRLQQSCFLVNFAKPFRTPILKNICERLLNDQLLLTLLLNSKNLSTSYEQLSYYQTKIASSPPAPPSNPNTNPNPNSNPNRGQFSSKAIVWLPHPPTLKQTLTLTHTPNLPVGQLSGYPCVL